VIVRTKDSFEFFATTFNESVVVIDIKKRINDDALITRFDVVAVNGQATCQDLLHIVTISLIAGFDNTLVLGSSLR